MIKIIFIFISFLLANSKVDEKKIIRRFLEYFPKNTKLTLKNLKLNKPFPNDAQLEWINPIPPIGIVTFKYYSPTLDENIVGEVMVSAYADIAVAKENIKFRERLTDKNVEFVVRCLNNYMGTGYFINSRDIIGLQSSNFIRRGTVLGKNNTMPLFMTISGQNVELVKESGALKLTATVRALQDGKKGDWIFVYNPSTKKTLKAEVVENGKVRIP